MAEIHPETVGYIAGILSSGLFVPQIVKMLRERKAKDFSLVTGIISVVSSALWLWYGVMNEHLSMIITNSFALSATILLVVLKLKFNGNGHSAEKK